MGSKAFENPLMPHARMRGLFRGLVETRALARRHDGPARGLEACWVAPAIGLEDGDFTSVAAGDALLEWITGLGTRDAAPTAAAVRRLGATAPEPFAGSASERVLCAVGAAMALAGGEGKSVAIAWLAQTDLTSAQWGRVAALMAAVPLILVAQPAPGKSPGLALASRNTGVPVIPVDAADAVAIYRVAQESILRAREDRQGAVIECIATGGDPIRTLAEQLTSRRICTPRWVESVAAGGKSLEKIAVAPARARTR